MSDSVHVAVAVIVNENNDVCLSLRHKDAHQGGLWEFPGGKIEHGETVYQALKRELKEELNISIDDSRPLITIPHSYKDKNVYLHVNRILSYQGQAVGVEGQEVRWVAINELSSYDFPAANEAIVKAIQLPDRYLITGKFLDEKDFLKKLSAALDSGIKLVQLRLKQDALDKYLDKKTLACIIQQSADLCLQADAKLLFNIPENMLDSIDLSQINFSGFHADSKTLNAISKRPEGCLFSASCHNSVELEKAIQLQADFVVLSPVQKTASHPDMQAMGWQQFSESVENCRVPVFALGGVTEKDMKNAWLHGAQGIAAISAFWQ